MIINSNNKLINFGSVELLLLEKITFWYVSRSSHYDRQLSGIKLDTMEFR